MNINSAPSIERTREEWGPIVESDVPEIKKMEKLLSKETHTKSGQSERISYTKGAVLKHAGKVLGYALYEANSGTKGPAVFVYQVYLSEKSRGASIAQLVSKIRDEAMVHGARYIEWSPGTDKMRAVTDASGAVLVNSTGWYRLPLEQFNVGTLIEMYREMRGANESEQTEYA